MSQLSIAASKMLRLSIVVACFSVVLAFPKLQSIPSLDDRIVGGKDADIKDYPYQLSLQFLDRHRCGAVSISPIWALTAAHCLEGTISHRFLSIRAGSSYQYSGGKIAYISETIVHPNYNNNNLDYDIALLRLSSTLTSEDTTPIALPLPGGRPSVGSRTNITGWGVTEEGLPSDVLQVVSVPVISQVDCRKAYGEEAVTDRMFCAGLLGVGGKDACQGDSGGPLVIDGTLAGLVSWGNGCAQPEYPGVYTNVAVFREWVEEITGV